MSRGYWFVRCTLITCAVVLCGRSSIRAQSGRPVFRSISASASGLCAVDGSARSADSPFRVRPFEESSAYSEDVCSTVGRGTWSRETAPPAPHREEKIVADSAEDELLTMGKAGFVIARARQEVLAILSEPNACSAWFARAEPEARDKLASLHFRVDVQGERFAIGEHRLSGVYYIGPYIARAQQDVGRGSTITLNAHGAFFEVRAVAKLRAWGGGPWSSQSPKVLSVGEYSGATLKAQVTTLLHEYAHIVGLVPLDYGEPDSALTSMQNTEEVVRRCRKQIEASPRRSVVLPAPERPETQPRHN